MEMDTDEQESESLLQTEMEGKNEKDKNGAVKRKDKDTSELQCHAQDSTELARRSDHPHSYRENAYLPKG